ncbi:hypothetical protein [Shewanella cyperi]|uniref:hypothetical protein n=1 Tax=Shewanella cyperi TaxID=2814292 RepID=UPI001A94FA85|nr:hypothetical protein [Shewanella cyperi]QSX41410.1 hypothetical protein JYB84_02945 [Shewanella cyperi]
MKKTTLALLVPCLVPFLLSGLTGCVQDSSASLAASLKDRWQLQDSGIRWQVSDVHQDQLEFSGEQVSAIIDYGTRADGSLLLSRKLVWPMLRTIPNDTHASLSHSFDRSPTLLINDAPVGAERLESVSFDGILTLESELQAGQGQSEIDGLKLIRTLAPATTAPLLVERHELRNLGKQAIRIRVNALNEQFDTPTDAGVYGSYRISAHSDFDGERLLGPGDSLSYFLSFEAQIVAEAASSATQETSQSPAEALAARRQYLASLNDKLVLETPDPVLDRMFAFAKLRAAESIFRTRGGLMHGPGGGRYYAAIWANDQAEYVNPLFPFLGDANGNSSAMNSFRHFARFMNPEYRPIPSSIIAEGQDIWNGAGDRGDCAMIAYGASRYALASGDEAQARQLLPLIQWCLEYNRRQLTPEGIVASDSDELEGRFPSGDANLSTNMLAYGGLMAAGHLYDSLGLNGDALRAEAGRLRSAIDKAFAARVEGYDTYRYYDGNDKLRAWIALPLVMGLNERQQGTLEALLSPKLWNENGIYSESGDDTFWDRATLYAFRGIFAAARTDTAMDYFRYYSRKRLLGEHVPYAVEAWPEGDQRQLSAESGLYARVITEGLFGIEPMGLKQFALAPRLPRDWPSMCLKHVQAFNDNLDICAERQGAKTRVKVSRGDAVLLQQDWDGGAPLLLSL